MKVMSCADKTKQKRIRTVISCWQLSPPKQEQGKENVQDFDSSTQVYIKLSLLMTIFEASHFVQYLNNKLFSIKAEGTATM